MAVKAATNFDVMGEVIGHLQGWAEAIERPDYMDEVITEAHSDAANAFDLAAGSVARAGYLAHMYEYGTAGITRGQVKFTDPTSAGARLWVHQLKGNGNTKEASFIFRPAMQRNPRLTTAYTGVPSKYIRKMSRRKYVFWNKAFVMESGASVEIKSERGKLGLLFIPTPGENAPKYHVLYPSAKLGAINAIPGRNTRGTFTAFWNTWWSSAGEESIQRTAERHINVDVSNAEILMASDTKNQPVKPAKANNIEGERERAKAKSAKAFGKG